MKIVIQGVRGCFHEEAAQHFFEKGFEVVEALSFDILARKLENDPSIDFAIMAIENSIAGSILQNYRILRDYKFRIIGELSMSIHLYVMGHKGESLTTVNELRSHPMAIYQSLDFLSNHPHLKVVETDDTALSAKIIADENLTHCVALASKSAAKIYDLEIFQERVESSNSNYTRFIILQNSRKPLSIADFNKASIYFMVAHESGSLLKCLQILYDLNINISKLQSYPVHGRLDKYYFYLDLEFGNTKQYEQAITELNVVTEEIEVLGVYKRGEYYS